MKTIEEIAEETRAWAEANRNPAYHYRDLCGMCAIASGKLFLALKENGYSPEIALNNRHVFVLCDGNIVDVTATQFDQSPIEIVPLDNELVHRSWWKIEEVFSSPDHLARFQEKRGWPPSQVWHNNFDEVGCPA